MLFGELDAVELGYAFPWPAWSRDFAEERTQSYSLHQFIVHTELYLEKHRFLRSDWLAGPDTHIIIALTTSAYMSYCL